MGALRIESAYTCYFYATSSLRFTDAQVSCFYQPKQVLLVFFCHKCLLYFILQWYFVETIHRNISVAQNLQLLPSFSSCAIGIVTALKLRLMLVKHRCCPLKPLHPAVSRGLLSWTSMKYVERQIDPRSRKCVRTILPIVPVVFIACHTRILLPLQSSNHQGSLRTHPCQRQIQLPAHGRGRSAYRLHERGLLMH